METFSTFMEQESKKKFDVAFLIGAIDFIIELSHDQKRKVLYNIKKSQFINDASLLKKINADIWEFRTKYNKLQIRVFCFRKSRKRLIPLVICTHGIIKKTSRILIKEIKKAEAAMSSYKDTEK